MPIEIEAKFLAADAQVLRRLETADALGPARLGPARTFLERDGYLDTADGRLAGAGWACRLRVRDGVTRVSLKGPLEDGGRAWLHRRPELEGPAVPEQPPATWPPSAARDCLLELCGGLPLHERVALHQTRTERAVEIDGHRVAGLTLDDVEVEMAGRGRGRIAIVELELSDGASEQELDRLAAELDATPGLEADPRTKLEHALALVGAEGR